MCRALLWEPKGWAAGTTQGAPETLCGPEQEQRVVQAERVACDAPQTARCPGRRCAGASREAGKVAGLGGMITTLGFILQAGGGGGRSRCVIRGMEESRMSGLVGDGVRNGTRERELT